MHKRDIDSFYIDLKVNCRIEFGHIKATSTVDLLINDKSKVVASGIVLETDQLREALKIDGTYLIYNCSCGHHGCAGIEDGIRVSTEGKLLHWEDLDAREVFVFEKLTILMQLNKLEKDMAFFQKKFKEFRIELVTE